MVYFPLESEVPSGMLGHHLLLLLHVPLAHAAAADDETFVVWASSPTLPGETVVLQTAQQAADLQLCSGGNCSEIALEQAWARGAKFSVPTDLKLAVWSISSGGRQLATINSAEPWWSICDRRVGNSASVPTECAPGASSLRVFGRALAFSADTCVRYNESLVHAAAAAATKLQLSDDSGTVIELGASEASCYTAEFELPGNLPPGTYSWSVKNNLDGADFSRVLEDLQQRTIAVHASTTPTVAAMHTPAIVPAGNVPALLAAVHSAKAGMTVMLPAGTWKMGALDRITVPDGVALRGSGSDATMLRWPTQTGAMCASFKRVNFGGPGLISGDDAGSTLGWSVSDLQIRVDGGLQQNDTVAGGQHAYCPIVTTQSKQYGKTTRGMVLENLVIHSVAPTGVSGVDMQAGGVGMGPAVSIGGSDHAIKNCSIIHLGDCGSNVTPLLSIGSSRTIISNNTFSFGCTLYAMHSVQSLLWERNTASNFTNLGRDGSVIGTFGPPFIAEHISFLGNSQVDNAKSPPGIVPVAKGGSCNGPVNVCANHRLETLTLDGGGGAYTGYVARASGLEVTLAADPFLNGSGSYIPYNDMVQSSWAGAAAMILSGPGAGQWRHITNHTGRIWRVDRPWSVQPDTNSKLQVCEEGGSARARVHVYVEQDTSRYS